MLLIFIVNVPPNPCIRVAVLFFKSFAVSQKIVKALVRLFPDKPFTKKPLETRMGKGKGPPEGWVAVVRPGRILYEMEGVSEEVAKEAFRLASAKLPLRCRFVSRQDQMGD